MGIPDHAAHLEVHVSQIVQVWVSANPIKTRQAVVM